MIWRGNTINLLGGWGLKQMLCQIKFERKQNSNFILKGIVFLLHYSFLKGLIWLHTMLRNVMKYLPD